ncbi:MAG: serine hydrolase [Bacteroidota bacterium]
MPLRKKFRRRLLIIVGVMALVNVGVWYYFFKQSDDQAAAPPKRVICDVRGFRRTGFKYTKPLLMLNRECDDPMLDPLRDKVLSVLAERQRAGKLQSVSVYFRLLDTGQNFNTSDEKYSPGSLMKVLTLITFLKDNEKSPGSLKKRILFDQAFSNIPSQLIPAATAAEFGKSYTVDELLKLMITQSDNNATALLNARIDAKVYNEVLSALNLSIPDPHQLDYPLSAEEYSRFFRLLYNSSFLSPEMSDYALELLTMCAYKNGFSRYVKSQVDIAHKFGEHNTGNDYQLHEGGIFFTGSIDYLLVVMSRGSDQAALQDLLADVSALVFYEMVANYGITPSSSPALTQLDEKKALSNG